MRLCLPLHVRLRSRLRLRLRLRLRVRLLLCLMCRFVSTFTCTFAAHNESRWHNKTQKVYERVVTLIKVTDCITMKNLCLVGCAPTYNKRCFSAGRYRKRRAIASENDHGYAVHLRSARKMRRTAGHHHGRASTRVARDAVRSLRRCRHPA